MKKPAKLPPAPENTPTHVRASVIARATEADKKSVRRLAKSDRWPVRWAGNRREYRVPVELQERCLGALRGGKSASGLAVFKISKAQIGEVERALNRFAALCALATAKKKSGYEAALDQVEACFDVNKVSLRQWVEAWNKSDFAGLMEHKRGRVGRKASQGKASHL